MMITVMKKNIMKMMNKYFVKYSVRNGINEPIILTTKCFAKSKTEAKEIVEKNNRGFKEILSIENYEEILCKLHH